MVWSLIENALGGGDEVPLAWKNRAKGVKSHIEDARAFTKATVTGPLDDDIVFVHVPKCAGITVDSAIRRTYRSVWEFEGKGIRRLHPGAADRVGDLYEESNWTVRESVIAYHLAEPDTRYVSGHFQVSSTLLERFADEFAFVTLLRDPVARWISHFTYNKYTPKDHRYHIHQDIETFLETDRARGIGQIFLSYFTGTGEMDPVEQRESDAVRKAARENLSRFEVIGFVEEMDGFRRQFEEAFDAEIKLMRRNVNPASDEEKSFPPHVMKKIRDVCAADIELYELARRQFGV